MLSFVHTKANIGIFKALAQGILTRSKTTKISSPQPFIHTFISLLHKHCYTPIIIPST